MVKLKPLYEKKEHDVWNYVSMKSYMRPKEEWRYGFILKQYFEKVYDKEN